jgi:phosphohistidine phosphatase SixA
MSHLILALALSLALPSFTAPELRREELMAALRAGGYTVILRHARTDRSFQEERTYVPSERSKQRNLTDDGIRDAALMGVVFRKYRISFAEILSSPMARTVETAEMAAGPPTTTMALRTIPSTAEQSALIATPPKPGTNRLIVTHHFVIETHVPGISPGDIAESEGVVVRHLTNGAVELVGRILLDDWRTLANPGQPKAAVASPEAGHTVPAGAHGPVPAGTGEARGVEIPDTHAGHLMRDYIAAFNSGSRDTMRTFIESSMQPSPDRTLEQRLDSYMKLFEEHGPITAVMVGSSASTGLTLGMKSRRGSFRMTLTSSEEQPMRVSSVTLTLVQGGHR